MEKREKILVAGMVIALCYGGYELVGKKYLGSSQKAPIAAEQEFTAVADMAKKVLAANPAGDLEKHVVMLVDSEFQGDPFSSYPKEQRESDLIPQLTKRYSYTGYVNLGKDFLAIINGLEYKLGDIIDGLPITLIDSTKVILKSEEGAVTIPIKGHLE